MKTTLTSILASLVFLFAIGSAGAAEPQETATQAFKATHQLQDTPTVEAQTATVAVPSEFAVLHGLAAEPLKGEEMDEVRGRAQDWFWFFQTYYYYPTYTYRR